MTGATRAGTQEAADDRPLVHVERRGPVAVVTLDSPGNRNALSVRLLAELGGALDALRDDAGVRAVVLTGAGPVFCSGVDLTERLHPPAGEPPATLAGVLSTLVAMDQPVIARVNGHVRAGGIGLVAACDLAAAPAEASFAFSEVRVGVAPAIIAVPALRRMGRRAFGRYALTGDVFGAADAERVGLVDTVVDDLAALDEWVEGVLASLLRAAPGALGATKHLADTLADSWDGAIAAAETLSDRMFASSPAAEGMAAFLEKRAPSWAVEWPPGG